MKLPDLKMIYELSVLIEKEIRVQFEIHKDFESEDLYIRYEKR